MSQLLKITSIKRVEEWTGPMDGAIERAKQIDAEYQPAYGVQIEDEDGHTLWSSNEAADVRHRPGCSCGAPDCPQWQEDWLA